MIDLRRILTAFTFSLFFYPLCNASDGTSTTNEWTPLKLSLPRLETLKPDVEFKSLDLPNKPNVYGLDIALPISKSKNMYGIQTGLMPESKKMIGVGVALIGTATEEGIGIQIGMAGTIASKDFVGIQTALLANNLDYDTIDKGKLQSAVLGLQVAGILNISDRITGIQISAINSSRKTNGMQIGILNSSYGDLNGIQIGLFNFAKSLKGLQIGLLNRVYGRRTLKTLPIINMGW